MDNFLIGHFLTLILDRALCKDYITHTKILDKLNCNSSLKFRMNLRIAVFAF